MFSAAGDFMKKFVVLGVLSGLALALFAWGLQRRPSTEP